MPTEYQVVRGDCISSIAFNHGFFWETLWNHSGNANLKAKRKDPNILKEGDQVYIPDLIPKDEARTTEKRHRFRRRGVPEKLRMVLLEANGEPREGWVYIVVIDGAMVAEGTLDSSGEIECPIRPNAMKGRVHLSKGNSQDVVELTLGTIDPIDTISGVQARLTNLGFSCGKVNGELGSETAGALAAFQDSEGITATGKIDDQTRSRLQEVHGF